MSVIIIRLIYYVVIAFLVGTVAQLVTGYHKRRFFTTLILGFIGVVVGDFAANRFGLWDFYIFRVSIIWSTLGAIIFILLFKLIRGRW